MTDRGFRKIPSLQYLYEINSDGTIVRNVKSKRRLKLRTTFYDNKEKDKVCIWASFSVKGKKVVRAISTLVAECFLDQSLRTNYVIHLDGDRTNNDYRNLKYTDGEETIASLIKCNSVPCELTDMEGNRTAFPNLLQAARFIAKKTNSNLHTTYQYLKSRRSFIHGFDVVY